MAVLTTLRGLLSGDTLPSRPLKWLDPRNWWQAARTILPFRLRKPDMRIDVDAETRIHEPVVSDQLAIQVVTIDPDPTPELSDGPYKALYEQARDQRMESRARLTDGELPEALLEVARSGVAIRTHIAEGKVDHLVTIQPRSAITDRE